MFDITVIVPVYNVEKYLERCLDSLIHQTVPVKILVVNDGSTDNSQKIIDQYQKQYSNQIEAYYKENSGIADTRNFALRKVQTKYFGFLDSDDYADSTMYEHMLKKAEQTGSDIVVSDFFWVYSDHQNIGKEGPYLPGKQMVVNLMATLWNKLYRTDFIRTIPVSFPKGCRYEDAYFLYCISPFVRTIEFIEKPFVSYVQREGSITHNHNDKVKDMVTVFKGILVFYKENNLFDDYKQELEYIFTKFFLGNSFLRSVQIKDKEVRNETLKASMDLLCDSFPLYYTNPYLSTLPGLKNRYFKIVRPWNYMFFAFLFGVVKR